MSRLAMFTASVSALVEAGDSNDPNRPGARITRLWLHIQAGGDPRTPPADWRPTYPLDDPRYEPDMWVSDLAEPTLWCKLDKHKPYREDDQPITDGCQWCGLSPHRRDERLHIPLAGGLLSDPAQTHHLGQPGRLCARLADRTIRPSADLNGGSG